ncbi:hypothetical protein IMSAGC021_00083 [Muribaculaceae bacterium]|nr:hypothetical protein IMSAGC021_00083 [Muribaculaceae bacterium]
MSNIKIIPPRIITLVSTFRCTASCKNCCFRCSPLQGKAMSFKEMKHYVDICMNEYGDSIKVLVITGGECMIYRNNIIKIIRYATSLGLSTRIVTNAFWATTYTEAKNTVYQLISAGLKEINFSTGDDHREWIPIKNVRNAAVAAFRLGLKPLINVESHDDSKTSVLKWLKRDSVFRKIVVSGGIIIEQGIWMSFNEESNKPINYTKTILSPRFDRCSSLFSVIPINPYGEVMACCGLTSENSLFLRIGNINRKPIREIYESSFQDLLKIWLFVDRPAKILQHIAQSKEECLNITTGHICDACRTLFNNYKNIEHLNEIYDSFATSTILKYQLLTSKLN